MKSTKQIIEKIGRERFQSMLRVGSKSVSRAMTKNQFTASWYDAVCKELEDLGEKPPARKLFNFKKRTGKRKAQ